MYNHQNDLMIRIVSVIANDFSAEADRRHDALEHYQWSKRMLGRYQKLTPKSIVIERVTSTIDTSDISKCESLNSVTATTIVEVFRPFDPASCQRKTFFAQN